jgi:plastocyanin
MQRVTRLLTWRTFALAGVVAVAAAAGSFMRTPDTSAATTATTYKAQTGGYAAPGISVNVFAPYNLTITEGDTIEWTNPSLEPHVVTFFGGGPPPKDFDPEKEYGARSPTYDGTALISSGFLEQGQTYSVRFSKGGNFPFLCPIHDNMAGNVTVLPPSQFVPGQPVMDAEARRIVDAGIAQGRRMVAGAPSSATRSSNAGGTSTWTIPNSPIEQAPNGNINLNAFTPARVSIGAGDTVTWLNDTFVPHTVTFTAGGPPRDPTQIVKAPNGTYDGTNFVNSGFLGDPKFGFDGGTRFSLTFPREGTYPYICILHLAQGMAGVIEVGPAGSGGSGAVPGGVAAPPGADIPAITLRPPSTGDAGLQDGASAAWPLALLVAFGGTAALGAMRARSHS